MYKVAILGCENSHADKFLNIAASDEKYSDVEFVGVYSYDEKAGEKMRAKYGVHVAQAPDEFVGKVDGIIITARHGSNHLPYALPYIQSGIPLFIDKPITVTADDAKCFKRLLIENKNKFTGGSSCIHSPIVKELAKEVKNGSLGKISGGFVRAPIYSDSEYDGIYFYAQHGIQMMTEIFGCSVISVDARRLGETVNASFRYDGFYVNILFTEHSGAYFVSVSGSSHTPCGEPEITDDLFAEELSRFHELLHGGECSCSIDEFFAPVYIMNALEMSLNSGKEENVLWED